MADAVAESLDSGVHLLVQAGTGTGKSLGYLAPALVWAMERGEQVVVATATLALQAQLANADIPTITQAVEEVVGRRPSHAIVKGRSNYACLLRVRDQVGGDEQDALLGGAELAKATKAAGADEASVLGAEVVALREWAEAEVESDGLADRDDAPPHTPRAWAQVSVPTRECVGVANCRYGPECLVEKSRARARDVDLVVTNHALLAVNALHGGTALPEHGAVVIDEAHELTARVTGAASAELSPQMIERVGRRVLPHLADDELALELVELGDALKDALDESEVGRVTDAESIAVQACTTVRAITRRVISALGGENSSPERTQVASAVKEVFDIAERLAALDEHDVVWVSERERFGRQFNVAPLSVAGLMRDRVLGDVPCVLTSATLAIGGTFDSTAASVGLRSADRVESVGEASVDADSDDPLVAWRGLDVGSPFDYAKQGICYIAKDLPNPGRDGIGPDALAQVAELVWAAGGRTLGLFASQRSAEAAAKFVRAELPKLTVLCQGDAQLSELTKRFVADEQTCLFGTLSLWQGVDVPGDTCQLVIIDKIPFPRPDDPLLQARQQAVAEAGGNGFMQVAATHAGLLLAQGSGRLIRRLSDRGVVAILDPRLAKARYGSFLTRSMPPFWRTTDLQVAIEALRRISGSDAEGE